LALGGWLVRYRDKCPAPGIEPGTVAISVLTGPDVHRVSKKKHPLILLAIS